jgi:hypothetical protein
MGRFALSARSVVWILLTNWGVAQKKLSCPRIVSTPGARDPTLEPFESTHPRFLRGWKCGTQPAVELPHRRSARRGPRAPDCAGLRTIPYGKPRASACAQFAEPARTGLQPIEANQVPFATDGLESGRKRTTGHRRLQTRCCVCRRGRFHKVTSFPESAFLPLPFPRVSMLAEAFIYDNRNADLQDQARPAL